MFCTNVCLDDALEATKILVMTILMVFYVVHVEKIFSKPIQDALNAKAIKAT
jgi:hypothetical protein